MDRHSWETRMERDGQTVLIAADRNGLRVTWHDPGSEQTDTIDLSWTDVLTIRRRILKTEPTEDRWES